MQIGDGFAVRVDNGYFGDVENCLSACARTYTRPEHSDACICVATRTC